MSTAFVEPIKNNYLKRRTLWWAAAVVLAAVVIVLIAHSLSRPSLPFTISDYESAVKKNDHDGIFEIYNRTRLKRSELDAKLPADKVKKLLEEADSLIDRIENDVKKRSEQMLDRVFRGDDFTEEEIAVLELDAAISGNDMTRFIEEKTNLYLFGKIDENIYLRFMGQLARVPIFSREYNQLLGKTEILQRIREELTEANEAAARGAHDSEAASIQRLLTDRQLTGIDHVTLYLEERMAKARRSYYDELIPAIVKDLDHNRTYDASLKIKKLTPWFPDDKQLRCYQDICDRKNPAVVLNWVYAVEHIAVKPLIADPVRAFDGDRFASSADSDLLLTAEFENILEQLYERGYVLVDGRSFATEDGKARAIPYPEGKKPICLVLDDFFSSNARIESGIAARLDLDADGRVVGVVRDRDGTERADRYFSAIGIVENFIDRHPDFSFNGATGTIAVIGRNGLFGYPLTDEQHQHWSNEAEAYGFDRTKRDEIDLEENALKVKAIISALTSHNWIIASGSYGRLAMDHAAVQSIADDIKMTEQFIEPYTGKLSILHYPYGLHAQFDKAKTALLAESGFSILSGYGTSAYSNQGHGFVYVSKTLLSGRALRQPREHGIDRFFKAGEVIDRSVRP